VGGGGGGGGAKSAAAVVADTDATTKTLAERLQELAVAHEDGLIDGEEYRVLRQSLFEKYASGANQDGTGSSRGDVGVAAILSRRERGALQNQTVLITVCSIWNG
jgi:hypothetical protein